MIKSFAAVLVCCASVAPPAQQTHDAATTLDVKQAEPLPVIGTSADQAVSFALSVHAQCADANAKSRLTINVADTTIDLSPPVSADTSSVLTIAADQLVGLNTATLCARRGETTSAQWLLQDAFNAQIALACSDDRQTIMTYAATPLAVTIDCSTNDPSDAAPESPASDPTPVAPQPRQNADRQD